MITTDVENYPGFPEDITGPELVNKMRAQAEKFGAVFIEEFATEFKFSFKDRKDDCKSCNGWKYIDISHPIPNDLGPCTCDPIKSHQVTIGDQVYLTDAIILANGARARWLDAKDEELYINRGISSCATCDSYCFKGKHMVVVGGGDSACEEALFIARFASKVTLIHRREKLRASKIMAYRVINNDKINILWNTVIEGYTGDTGGLNGVVLNTNNDGLYIQECAVVFMAIGHVPNTKGLEHTKLLDKEGYIKVKDNVYTDIPGVFAAGDCADTKYRQAITAAGFGCMASMSAEKWIGENE